MLVQSQPAENILHLESLFANNRRQLVIRNVHLVYNLEGKKTMFKSSENAIVEMGALDAYMQVCKYKFLFLFP